MNPLLRDLFTISESDERLRTAERAWQESPSKESGLAWFHAAQRSGAPAETQYHILHEISGHLDYYELSNLNTQIKVSESIDTNRVIAMDNPLAAFYYLLGYDDHPFSIPNEQLVRLLSVVARDPRIAMRIIEITEPWHLLSHIYPQPARTALANIASVPQLAYQYSLNTINPNQPQPPTWGMGGPDPGNPLDEINQRALQSIISVPAYAVGYARAHKRFWPKQTPLGAAALQSIASTPQTAFEYAKLGYRWIPGEPGAEVALKNIKSNSLLTKQYKALINKKRK